MPEAAGVEIDWRMGFTILFYVVFAFVQATLASTEQKPGIRSAMGLGIMFAIDEILIQQDLTAFIMEGKKSDPNIQMVLSFFPASYATFEVIILIRIFYFLCFNVICAISITYVIDETKERVIQGEKMRKNQIELYKLSQELLNTYEGKEIDLDAEFKKKPYATKKA